MSLCSLSPGTRVPGETLLVYVHVVCLMERLQGKACRFVSWRGSRGRHVAPGHRRCTLTIAFHLPNA